MIGVGSINSDAARVLGAYGAESRGVRVHTRVRWRSCPFAAVEAQVPRAGRILDLGCGHGVFSLYLARTSPDREVTGVDIDAAKVEIAERAAARLGAATPTFEAVEAGLVPGGDWDAITIVDVLYLMGGSDAQRLLLAAARALRPGGVLVIKELDVHPRWKFQVARFQEVLATRVLRITKGSDLHFMAASDIAASIGTELPDVRLIPLDRGWLHPHHLVVARA